jgi:muramidase (phage lysozyme)
LQQRSERRRIEFSRSAADIKRIAASLNLSSGIVAGRYQFLTQKWSSFNSLITKFVWTRKSA